MTLKPVATVKHALRRAIAAPGVRHGLRWLLSNHRVPRSFRELAHRKVAKRAKFKDGSFTYVTPDGTALQFLHRGTPNYLYWLNEYEPPTTKLFCRLARDARVILDIGSADGIYAVLAAAANPDAQVLAFEPGEDAAATCARNIQLNLPLTRSVDLVVAAIGEEDMESTLYVAGETGGTSSLNPEFRRDRVEQRVRVHEGDRFLRDKGVAKVDLIKMDTESTEPSVLRGLRETLERDKPDVICEVLYQRTERELEAVLSPLGYRYYWITEHGLERRDALVGDSTYRNANYLFTHRSEQAIEMLSSSTPR